MSGKFESKTGNGISLSLLVVIIKIHHYTIVKVDEFDYNSLDVSKKFGFINHPKYFMEK